MNVALRLRVTHVDETETVETVHARAVYSADPTDPNYSFSQATPSADLTMTITNPAAFGFFIGGRDYDFAVSPVAAELVTIASTEVAALTTDAAQALVSTEVAALTTDAPQALTAVEAPSA